MTVNLKHLALGATAAVSIASAGIAADRTQLIANARLTPAEAEQLTLNEIAARFFNRSSGDQDQQTVPASGPEYRAVVAARGPAALSPNARQLAASAGLSAEEARGMSLRQIAAHFFNRSSGDQDQQTVPASGPEYRAVVAARWPATLSPNARQLAASAGLSAEEAHGVSLRQEERSVRSGRHLVAASDR
jgi:hypothetical protein